MGSELKNLGFRSFRAFVPGLALAAMVFAFTFDLAWLGKVPSFRDLLTYHYPSRFLLAQAFRAGEIPLWATELASGIAFAANPPAAVFYPFHLIFLVLPFFEAVRTLFVFHYMVAAIGGYLLFRQWGCSAFAAVSGSVLFSFGGLLVSLENMLDYFQTAVWLPWVLLCGERAFSARAWRNGLGLTLVLLLQFLAGHPETYVMSLGLLFLDGLRLCAVAQISLAAFLVQFFTANVLVASLGMVQLLPSLELFLNSARFETLPYDKVVAWSLHPLRLVNLLFLDKEIDMGIYSGLHLLLAREPPLLLSLYMGPVALSGLFFWLSSSGLRERLYLSALLLFVLALALGGDFPLYGFLHSNFPMIRLFRFPEKFFFPLYALLIFAVVRGLNSLQDLRSERGARAIWAMGMVSLLVTFGYILLRYYGDSLARFLEWAKGPGQAAPPRREAAIVFVFLERQILLMLGIFLLLFLLWHGKLQSKVFQILFVSLAFFDLALAHRPYHFPLDPGAIPRVRPIMDIVDPSAFRFFYMLHPSDLHPNVYAFRKRPYPGMVEAFFANLIPNAGVLYGIRYAQELDSLRKAPYDSFLQFARTLPPQELYRLLGALNVKYVNSFGRLPEPGITLIRHLPEYPSWLYRVERVVPSAYVVGKVVVEADPVQTLGKLASEGFDPLRQVILQRPWKPSGEGEFGGQAEVVSHESRRVVLRASLSRSGVLVLADSYYPGWRVYVDGEEKEILRANLFFRAVPLLAGEHVVEFRYEPRSFYIGAIVSMLALLGLVAATVVVSFRQRGKA